MDVQDEVYPHNAKIIIRNEIISVTKRNREHKVLMHSPTQGNLANAEDSQKKVTYYTSPFT